MWHWTLFAAVLLVGVAAQIAANARLGVVVRRLEATTGAGEVAEGASRGVAARFEAVWVLAVLGLVSFGVGRCGLRAARLDDRADAAAGRGACRAASRHGSRADRERRWAARLRDLALPDQQRHTMDRPAVLDGFFGLDGR